MTDTILRFTSCYGCGVCAIACPVRIITVSETPDGFYSPVIHEKNNCIHCGLCLMVCAYNDGSVKTSDQIKTESYAAWSTDPLVRKECSSGGVGFAIAAGLLRKGYKACGVRYNVTTHRAEHFMASDIVAFEDSRGSKYLPSYTLPGFSEFNRKDRFLVTGTPCQIDSLRRWLRKTKAEDRYVLMDFFCHGVPSMHLWRKYLHHVSTEIENPVSVAWRDKKNGWHDSYVMSISDDKQIYQSSFLKNKDMFYRFFLGNVCLGKACYCECKYKMTSSAADIRIGDLWGRHYEENKEGVSALLAFTTRGREVLHSVENCHLESLPLSVVTEGQMKKRLTRPWVYPIIMRDLAGHNSLSEIYKWIQLYLFTRLPYRILRRVRYLLHI